VHDDAHKVLKDITKWKSIVKAPRIKYPDSDWEEAIKFYEGIDRNEVFAATAVFPGCTKRSPLKLTG
jgi:hypothetical protein